MNWSGLSRFTAMLIVPLILAGCVSPRDREMDLLEKAADARCDAIVQSRILRVATVRFGKVMYPADYAFLRAAAAARGWSIDLLECSRADVIAALRSGGVDAAFAGFTPDEIAGAHLLGVKGPGKTIPAVSPYAKKLCGMLSGKH